MNRSGLALATFAIAAVACGPREIYRHEPVVVTSPLRVDGAVVQGAGKGWYLASNSHPRYNDPVPVILTSYCLGGTTRRGRYVRSGIVAADPKYFPLSRYVEVYIGRNYYGRFLVDDTGRRIKGNHLDIWLPTCRESKRFGVKHGTAVLIARAPEIRQAGTARPAAKQRARTPSKPGAKTPPKPKPRPKPSAARAR